MNPSFTTLDHLVLIAGLGAVLVAGLRRSRSGGGRDLAAYLVAGRAVTLPGFVANLVASWYGGILGVGESAYRYGLSNWLTLGVPYYVAALLFALFLAGRAHRTGALTIPDQLRAAYGPTAGFLAAAVVLVLALPGAYVQMAGTLVGEMFSLPQSTAVVVVAAISASYLVFGGMRAIVATDRVYLVLMYSGFAIMVGWLGHEVGGIDFLRRALAPELLGWSGGRSAQAVLVWYGIGLATLIEPMFYEACFAARSARTARTGIAIAIVFWAIFDAMTTVTGLYARVLLPDLETPQRAFPLLAQQILPPGLRGFFFVAMLATVLSTVDSTLFISAQTLGHDLAWRWRNRRRSPADGGQAATWTRWALVPAAAGAIGIALSGLTVLELWHHLGSIGTPALLVPTLSSLEPRWRLSPRFAVASIVASAAVAAAWLVSGGRESGYWLGLEPFFPALAVSLALWAVGWLRRPRPAA